MQFVERFNEELRICDLTQLQLAKALNLDPTNITKWKKGENFPSLQALYALCKLLDLSADYLLGLTDEQYILANNTPAIPAREQQLLADFRSLAPALQEMLLATIETWKGSKANASTGKHA